MNQQKISWSGVQASLVPCCLVPALCFHISLAGLAACSITFNYPPCQQTDSACLLALVITGFRGQVIRSWLHCHPVRLLRPQGAYGMKEVSHLQSVISYSTRLRYPEYCLVWSRYTFILLQYSVMCWCFSSFRVKSSCHVNDIKCNGFL